MSSEKFVDYEDASKIIQACLLHFKGRSLTKYGWRSVKISDAKILKDRSIVRSIMNRYQTDERLLAAMSSFLVRDPNAWMGDVLKYEDAYYHLKQWKSEPRRMFHEELTWLMKTYNLHELLEPKTTLKVLIKGDMTPEFFVALNRVVPVIKYMDKVLGDDFVWQSVRDRFIRYQPFLTLADDEIKENLKDQLQKAKNKKKET